MTTETKTVYLFDSATGEFIQPCLAHADPLEEGNFITPTDSTDLEPPKVGENEVAVFKENGWTLFPDYRNCVVYSTQSGQRLDVEQIGPLKVDQTLIKQPTPQHFWDKTNWRLSEVDAKKIVMQTLTQSVQQHLDATAQSLGYDDIRSAATYADEPAVAKFQNEGKALRAWRSLVWASAYDKMMRVMAGNDSVPTPDQLIIGLPVFTLPK